MGKYFLTPAPSVEREREGSNQLKTAVLHPALLKNLDKSKKLSIKKKQHFGLLLHQKSGPTAFFFNVSGIFQASEATVTPGGAGEEMTEELRAMVQLRMDNSMEEEPSDPPEQEEAADTKSPEELAQMKRRSVSSSS